MSVPANSFFVTGGTLRHDAPSYVERRADQELYAGLVAGEFCYVLTSRQMGKSSLMVRTVKRLRAAGASVAVLDLTAIGQNLTPEQWYDGLMARLGQQLDLEDELLEFWRANPQWGPLQRWLTALEKVILPELSQRKHRTPPVGADSAAAPSGARLDSRLIVFIDEIDVVRSLPFSTDEFFAALRECYNRRTSEAIFNQLTFCLIGVATPSDLIRETRMTPFNIGRRIELTDFTADEVSPLVSGLVTLHSDEANAATDGRIVLERILHWTGGHPYLTQRLCRAVAEASAKAATPPIADANGGGNPAPGRKFSAKLVDELCTELFLCARARERDDNLIFVRERLLNAQADRASLLHLYARVREGKKVPDEETNSLVSVLHLAGIVRSVNGRLQLRNRIYERVFDLRWVAANMPDAELRRQREAFRRGVVRTVAVGGALVLALSIWLLVSLRSRNLDLVRKLSDGSVITLEAVLPSSQPFVFGKFRTALFDALAQAFRGGAGAKKEFRYSNPDEAALVAWFTRKDPEDNRCLNVENFSHLEILDDHGCRMSNSAGEIHTGNEVPLPFVAGERPPLFSEDSSVILVAGELRVFPRRQPSFTLKFIDRHGELMASFTNVPNPAFVRTPSKWRPEMLPSTHRDGDLAVTLKQVVLELDRWSANGVELRTAKVKPEFELSQNGQPTMEWEIGESLLADPGGNRVKLPADQETMPIPMLCLREPAWRLRMEFFRKPQSQFLAQDAWSLGGMTIPLSGAEVSFANQTNRLHNLNLKLLAIGGGSPGKESSASSTRAGFVWRGKRLDDLQNFANARSYFTLQFSGRTAEMLVTLRLRDHQNHSWTYAIEAPREGLYQILTEAPPGTPLAEAALIVQKPRVVAFEFKPPVPFKQ